MEFCQYPEILVLRLNQELCTARTSVLSVGIGTVPSPSDWELSVHLRPTRIWWTQGDFEARDVPCHPSSSSVVFLWDRCTWPYTLYLPCSPRYPAEKGNNHYVGSSGGSSPHGRRLLIVIMLLLYDYVYFTMLCAGIMLCPRIAQNKVSQQPLFLL